tara:strand:- start:3782 stop:4135 length:354 start_codon:yes stop_codon:yes gene_type:complete
VGRAELARSVYPRFYTNGFFGNLKSVPPLQVKGPSGDSLMRAAGLQKHLCLLGLAVAFKPQALCQDVVVGFLRANKRAPGTFSEGANDKPLDGDPRQRGLSLHELLHVFGKRKKRKE